MRQDEHALAFSNCVIDDCGGDDGFAGARWHDEDDSAFSSFGDVRANKINHVALVWAKLAHRAAARSSATPSGDDGLTALSRISARRMTSSGTPYWRAIDATTAESFAAESECEPALLFDRKISASRPSEKNETVATYCRPLHSKAICEL